MKTSFLVSLIAILTVITIACPAVMAANLSVSDYSLSVRGQNVLTTNVISGEAGETIPISVSFTAGQDDSNVKVKAEIDGYRSDIVSKTQEFNMVDGSLYTKSLSVTLPSDIDPTENYTLKVSIVAQDGDYGPEEYTFAVQRPTYKVDVLEADCSNTATAGSDLPIDVVVKNIGFETLDDVFVTVGIPQLGISKQAYFEDLTALDNADNSKKDSSERRIYLRIPSNVAAGVYDLEVKAYNADASESVTKKLAVVGAESESNIIAPITSKEIVSGTTTSYDIVIINTGDGVGVYNLAAEAANGVAVSISEPVAVVAAGSSKVVKVDVKGITEGTQTFAINVNSADGALVKKVTMTAVVSAGSFTGNVAILTLVLAIIFIVLLAVLVVLLTRKPAKAEEFEESYY